MQEALIEKETSKDHSAAVTKPVLTVFRLTKDEFGVRPIALAGTLGDASPATVAEAPVTTTSGTFNAFSTECTRDTQWVVSFPLLLMIVGAASALMKVKCTLLEIGVIACSLRCLSCEP